MAKARVSVAIGTWNRAAMVKEAIESALQQTRPPDEILVSDDASPDHTVEMLRAMAAVDPRIHIYVQPKNTGGVPNWNAAIERCSGDLIAWCSDDDRFLPDHLAASAGYLEEHPEVDLVHSGFVDAYEDASGPVAETLTPLRSTAPVLIHGKAVLWYLIRYYAYPFQPSTLVFRRSLWDAVGPFDPSFDLADTDWFVRAALQGTIAYLPMHSAVNRRHANNWSLRTGSVRMHREVDDAMRASLRRMEKLGVSKPELAAMSLAWRLHHQYRLSRLYLARSRAGELEISEQVADELRKSLGFLAAPFPPSLFRSAGGQLSRLIRRAQLALPSGAEKYRSGERSSPK